MSKSGAEQARKPQGQSRAARRADRAERVIFKLVQPRPVRIGLACTLAVSVMVTFAVYVGTTHAQHHVAQASLYGPSNAAVLAAVRAAGWPQQQNNWCGVATVAAIARFRGQPVSQQNVADYLNSPAAVSEWGRAPTSPYYWGPAFAADISGDVGTDPRALAGGLTGVAGASYHDLIEFGSNYDATLDLVYDLMRTHEPISVIVFHGLHSVLVSGVVATDNPVSDPGSITGLEVWDPGFGIPSGNIQSAQEVMVPLATWLGSPDYWATPYAPNYFGSISEDPDPSVGAYSYDPSQNGGRQLWIGHYIYMRPDGSGDPASGVSPDWAFDQTGSLIEGFHAEIPSGYTGPAISVPAKLRDTSIDGPAFWSQSAYRLPGGSFDPATVLAWTGTDRSHHLNVETSQDGLNFQNKVVLNETSIARPSVIVVPAASGNVVVIAWTGTDRSHHLNVIYDVYGSAQKVTLSESSLYSPSLAYFGGQIWMSWAGTDGGRTLNVLALGPQGLVPGVKTILWSYGSHAAPELTPDPTDNLLLLSWQMASTTHVDFFQSSDGSNWTLGIPAPFGAATPFSPAMMVINSPPANIPDYYLCWAGLYNSLDFAPSATLTSWANPIQGLILYTIGAPALGFNTQYNQVLIAWTGTDRHMNVVMLPG
jgi:hypothetical protein